MSYRHYETESYILSLSGERGANRTVFLLARELGPIRAHAQGLRRQQSKLRYSLQAPARARVTLVKGKDIWRIVGAEEGEIFWQTLKGRKEALALVERLFVFLEKILVGDEANEKFFGIIEGVINYVKKEHVSTDTIFIIELIALARLLSILGYFEYPDAEDLLERQSIKEEDIERIKTEKKAFLSAVNAAIKSSHI